MATFEELQQALVNADRAGDVEAARMLAAQMQQMIDVAPPVEVTPPREISTGAESARSLASGALLGFADELEAALRTGSISSAEYISMRDRLRAQQEQFAKENPALAAGTQLAGGLVMPGAAMLAPVRGMTLGKELLTGAGLGGIAGVGAGTGDNTMEDFLQGAALGGATTGILGAGTRAIAPRVRPEARQLMREGVEVTPGAAFGGAVQRIEQAAESVPITGAAITAARERGLKSFDIASVNRVLNSIDPKIKVPKGTEPADAIEFAKKQIDNQYENKILPFLKFDPQDINFRISLENSVKRHKGLSADNFANLQRQAGLLVDDLSRAQNPKDIQRINSQLSRDAFDFKNSNDPNAKAYGRALDDMRRTFFANLESQNEPIKGLLKNANRAYTDYLRVASAFSRSTAGEVSTPAQLAQTIRQMSESGGRIGFAEGRASPLQNLAQAGERVLGTKLPTSGTAERTMVGTALTGGGLGLGYLSPEAGALAAIAAATSPLLYSQFMTQRGLPFLLQERPRLVQQVGERLRFAAPFAAPSLLSITEE
jgi:hypothetical protein